MKRTSEGRCRATLVWHVRQGILPALERPILCNPMVIGYSDEQGLRKRPLILIKAKKGSGDGHVCNGCIEGSCGFHGRSTTPGTRLKTNPRMSGMSGMTQLFMTFSPPALFGLHIVWLAATVCRPCTTRNQQAKYMHALGPPLAEIREIHMQRDRHMTRRLEGYWERSQFMLPAPTALRCVRHTTKD